MKILLYAILVAVCAGVPFTPALSDRSTVMSFLMRGGFEATARRHIDTIVLHSSYNAIGGDVYSVERLIKQYRRYGVSAHYLIDRKGKIYQLVSDTHMSFHAGRSKMPDGRMGVNRFSLGIELMNTRTDTYTKEQYSSLRKLIVLLKKEHDIEHIVGHGQIAPKRRSDPWNFDWDIIRDL